MSASDNLSQQLFHGSPHAIKTGDVITPRGSHVAYASSDPSYSDIYAVHVTPTAKQRALFGMNYKVEPVDSQEMHDTTEEARSQWVHPADAPQHVYVSTKGFRVTGVHEYVPYNRQ